MLSRKWWMAVSLIAVLGAFIFHKANIAKEAVLTIGIIQTATHPALDQTREGFVAKLSELTNQKVRFIIQNAEGSLVQAQNIAQSFHAHKRVQAILAIGTPAVQAAARLEKNKPIFIAAVSDPQSLGILHPDTNVCGTTDRIDTDNQAKLILKLLPKIKKVAILYNPGENNSQVMVEKMKSSLLNRNLEPLLFGVHLESEIAPALASIAHKADALLIPADNLIASAISFVAKEAIVQRLPLITSDITLVKEGALIAQGIDYSTLGEETASMAFRVLILKEKPINVGISHPTNSKILVNKQTSEALQIDLPLDLKTSLTIIEGGSNDS